jgi:hypothetical protein
MRNNEILALHLVNFFNNIHKGSHGKRLCEISVSAQDMRIEFILFPAFSADHNDEAFAYPGAFFQVVAKVKSIHAGKHDIQDNDIKICLAQPFTGNTPVKGLLDIKTFLAQVISDQVIDVRLIFNNKDIFLPFNFLE